MSIGRMQLSSEALSFPAVFLYHHLRTWILHSLSPALLVRQGNVVVPIAQVRLAHRETMWFAYVEPYTRSQMEPGVEERIELGDRVLSPLFPEET